MVQNNNIIYDECINYIYGELIIKNSISDETIIIKSDVTDIRDCTVTIEDLIGEMFYKISDFDNCESQMIIHIEIETVGTPIIELNRTYLKILDKIKANVIFDISYKTKDKSKQVKTISI